MAQFATLADLEAELTAMGSHSPEYWEKQVHRVPKSKTVNRNEFLVQLCAGKTILHVGCTGTLDKLLREATKKCYGFDALPLDRPDFTQVDLDKLWKVDLPALPDIELIVCGEVLEHLSNPGIFLDRIKEQWPTVPLAVTVPNAFTTAGQSWLVKQGRENVNGDHVCYYSYTTLKELLRRAGYAVTAHYWYNGEPYLAEGFIALVRPA